MKSIERRKEILKLLGGRYNHTIFLILDSHYAVNFNVFLKFMPDINHTLLSERLKEFIRLGLAIKNDKKYFITDSGRRILSLIRRF